MLTDLIAIFKARRDPALAARLAAKLAQGQLLDRLSAPLFMVHLIAWAVVLTSLLLAGLFLAAAAQFHWSAGIPAVLPLAAGSLAVFVHVGLRRGLARVRAMAENLTDQGLDRILPARNEEKEGAG